MALRKGENVSKRKRARVEKGKQKSQDRYEENLFLNSESSEKYQSNFSQQKAIGERIVKFF